MDLSNAEFGFSANLNILKRQESVANLSKFVSFSAFLDKCLFFLFIVTTHILLFCRKRKFSVVAHRKKLGFASVGNYSNEITSKVYHTAHLNFLIPNKI